MREPAKLKFLYARLLILLEVENFFFKIVDFFRKRRAKVVYKINKIKHPNAKVVEDNASAKDDTMEKHSAL